MSEQNIARTEIKPETTEPVSPTPKVEKPKRVRPTKKVAAKTAKKVKSAKPMTDEQKRLAKNAAVRAWRAANKERFSKYMSEWRAAKKAKDNKATKKTTAKKAKRIGKAATA